MNSLSQKRTISDRSIRGRNSLSVIVLFFLSFLSKIDICDHDLRDDVDQVVFPPIWFSSFGRCEGGSLDEGQGKPR